MKSIVIIFDDSVLTQKNININKYTTQQQCQKQNCPRILLTENGNGHGHQPSIPHKVRVWGERKRTNHTRIHLRERDEKCAQTNKTPRPD